VTTIGKPVDSHQRLATRYIIPLLQVYSIKIWVMKKNLILSILMMSTIWTQAQFRIGVHGDVIGVRTGNYADPAFSSYSQSDFYARLSVRGGVTAFIPLSGGLFIMPELNMLDKGGRVNQRFDFTSTAGDGSTKTGYVELKGHVHMTYLEMPVNLVFFTNTKAKGWYFGLGPSFGLGLKGKVNHRISSTDLNLTTSEQAMFNTRTKVKFDGKKLGYTDDGMLHYRQFEYGIHVVTGYQMKEGIHINLFLDKGLNDIDARKGYEAMSLYYGAGIGYFF